MKVRNLIDDMHKKLAKWLCEKCAKHVLLPAFETSGMIRKGQRKITSKTVRGMVTWSHYRFRQRMLHKAIRDPKDESSSYVTKHTPARLVDNVVYFTKS